MPFASRLMQRRPKKTLSVKYRDHASTTYAETTRYSNIEGRHERVSSRAATVSDDINGTQSIVVDVIWFYPQSDGTHYTINRGDVLTDSDSNRFEVVDVAEHGSQHQQLRVECRNLKWFKTAA